MNFLIHFEPPWSCFIFSSNNGQIVDHFDMQSFHIRKCCTFMALVRLVCEQFHRMLVHKHTKIVLLLLILSFLNLQVMCKKLKVGVLTRRKFKYFIDADHDNQNNVTTATGFSVDVFLTCVHALPYEVQFELIPYPSGSYDDLIKKVYVKEIDAILGDSTILANRSQYVDFTSTYTDMGIGTLVKLNNNGEKLSSNLSKLVLFVWLLVVLIIISNYTATLSSLLTVEQFELASKGGTVGFHGGSFEAGVAGVTVSNLHFEDYRRRPFYLYEDYADALSKGGKHGGADAIIDEIPYIKMFLAKYSTDYTMVSSEPSTSGFAFIFQKGSPLVTEISRQIAKIREDGTLRILEKKWFEKHSLSSQDPPTKPKTLSVDRFKGLFIISGISLSLALVIPVISFFYAKLDAHRIISIVVRPNLVAALTYLLRRNAIRI